MPRAPAPYWRTLTLTAVGLFTVLITWRIQHDVRALQARLLLAQTESSASSVSTASSDSSVASIASIPSSSSVASSTPSSSLASSAASSLASSAVSSSSVSSGTISSVSGEVVPIDPGGCGAVKPDPLTGLKLVYCCLDEIYTYQKEADQAEAQRFMQRLDEVQLLPGSAAEEAFENPFDGPIHRKYNWTTLCGRKVPCDICSANHICGNGVREAEEKCDEGPLNSDDTPDKCRLDCTLPRCGDNVIDVKQGEACDDGPSNSDRLPNSCRSTCQKPKCGDRVIDTDLGETCDAGTANSDRSPNSCRTNCQLAFCGDGVMDRGEECDDKNNVNGDGCNNRCALEKKGEVMEIKCGNGVVDQGEQCDTGQMNANVPDACRQNCLRPTCGDKIKDSNEECDDGNMASGDGCNAACKRELQLTLQNQCGDGSIDSGESCDAGDKNANIPDACRANCTFPQCGDGITDSGEQCDDGNLTNGDGCNDQCFSEYCGDGILRMGEECDDGNLISGDGCDALCRKEIGKAATAQTVTVTSAASFSTGLRPAAPASSFSSSVRSAVALPVSQAGSVRSLSLVVEQPAVNGVPPPLLPLPPLTQPSSLPGGTPPSYTLPPLTASVLPRQWTMSETGPATLSILSMGAAAGLAWMRRRRK